MSKRGDAAAAWIRYYSDCLALGTQSVLAAVTPTLHARLSHLGKPETTIADFAPFYNAVVP